MANHKVQQVVEAVEALLGALTTTGAEAHVHYDMELNLQHLPAINIRIGPVALVEEHMSTQDWALTLFIEAYVAQEDSYWETLLTMQKEVHAALRADYTVGLAFVHNIGARGFPEGVEVNSEGDITTARLLSEWEVIFRASLYDASL